MDLANLALDAYRFTLPATWISIAAMIFVLLPMSFFKKTRPFSGRGFCFASYIIGFSTWFLGAAITFDCWGWLALILGILIAGVGVVPIGILAAFISLGSAEIGFSLLLMAVIVIASRIGGMFLMASE